MKNVLVATVILAACCLSLAGCWNKSQPEVVVYCALDQEFAEPILQEFEEETGIRVRAKYDIESTKTVGLVNAILQERARPRCDLFWNNEILHTLRLEEEGLLAPFEPAACLSGSTEHQFSSQEGTYYGLAARARVLLVNTELVSEERMPTSVRDLIDPRWQNKVAIAKPLFGTTATHAAVLWERWGAAEAEEFFTQLKANARILSGNKQVAQEVGRGTLAFGLTDTDDAIIELEAGRPVKIIFPDQAADQMGAVFIPNTVCILKDAPHPDAARQLANKIVSHATEAKLAAGPSAQIPILLNNQELLTNAQPVRSRVEPTQPVRPATVNFSTAAEKWEAASEVLMKLFSQ